jgi:serine/threonine-protein kinase
MSVPGDRIGPYVTLRVLGRGGMGEVLLARDPRLQRKVALKSVIAGEGDAASRDQILREARAAALISHANVAHVYDVLEQGPRLFIVMEYVEGDTLATRIARGPLPSGDVVSIGRQLATGLGAAHAHGVIHRDLKPSNVYLTNLGIVKILDFGIARVTESTVAEAADVTGTTIGGAPAHAGTPPYMSPEQLLGHKVDSRSDLYGLGVVLYEMAVGQRPYIARDRLELAMAVVKGNFYPAHLANPDVPEWLSDVISKLLSPKGDDRFQSADDVVRALDAGDSRAGDAAARTPARRWMSAALVAAAVLALTAPLAIPAGRRLFAPAPSVPMTVLVPPVENYAGDERGDAIANIIRALVAGNLRAVPEVIVQPAATSTPARFVVDLRVTSLAPALQLSASLRRGDTSTPLWSRVIAGNQLSIERELLDGLSTALQNAGAWRTRLTDADNARLHRLPTSNAEALDAYATARALLDRDDAAGNLPRAVDMLKSAVAKDPSFALAYAALTEAYGMQYQRTRDPSLVQAATDASAAAVREGPAEGQVFSALGYLQNLIGRREDASRSLRRAVQLQPHNDNAHRRLGLVLADTGDVAGGIAEAKEAVLIRPLYWNHHYTLGFILYNAARYHEAAEAFRRVTDLEPNLPRGYLMLGASMQRAGNHQQAIGNYEHAVRLGPNPSAYSNLGLLYYNVGRIDDAVRAFQMAVDEEPGTPVFYLSLSFREFLQVTLGESQRFSQRAYRGATQVVIVTAVSPVPPRIGFARRGSTFGTASETFSLPRKRRRFRTRSRWRACARFALPDLSGTQSRWRI